MTMTTSTTTGDQGERQESEPEEASPPLSSSRPKQWLSRALDELGLLQLWHSNPNVKLLILQRAIRLAGYGSSTLILVAFLSALGTPDTRTGLFMTLTLAGDVLISLSLTLIADKIGRRKVLAFGAALMSASGVAFALASDFWILLAAAVLGVITPSGNEIGPFRAIEESTLAHLTKAEERPSIFAWYVLLGTAGASVGLMMCGWVTGTLVDHKGWTPLEAYRVVYLAYAVLGLVKLGLSLALGRECEVDERPARGAEGETAPLLNGGAAADAAGKSDDKRKKGRFAMLPTLSRESKIVLLQLCILFALDNFASGLVPLSWLTTYFHRHFALPSPTLGTLFSTTSLLAALSSLPAASLARRIGNIPTMVLTHLPSSLCLALLGLPTTAAPAITLLLIRSLTQSMDTAPRSAFLAAVVLPAERTAVVGVVNVVKTLAQSCGPLVTGVLAGSGRFAVAFAVAGGLKCSYDLGMLGLFLGFGGRERKEDEEQEEQERRREG